VKYSFSLTNIASAKPHIRQRVERLEESMRALPQVECPVRNLFAPGVYVREMTVPAGITATGAVHKTEHMTIIDGHCWLTTDDGVSEFQGRNVIVSKPGTKRATHAVTETIVTTIHPTDETDEEKLVALLTESTKSELLGGSQNLQLLANREGEQLCRSES
jgi:hypothetical protein